MNKVINYPHNNHIRGGIEEQQLEHLVALLYSVILSNSNDRWVSDLNGDGVFRVKDVRNLLVRKLEVVLKSRWAPWLNGHGDKI
ncbi:hypothetical protein Tco_0887445 [Tanacetum coccineum]